MGHWGTCPSSFGNSVHYTAADSLTVKISKITKEKHVLNLNLSRQKHAKTHENRLKLSRHPKESPGRGGKIHIVPRSPHSWRRHWATANFKNCGIENTLNISASSAISRKRQATGF